MIRSDRGEVKWRKPRRDNQSGADWSKQIQNIESITSEVQCWCVIDTVKSNAEVDCPVDMWYNGDGGGVSVVQ